MTIVEKDPNETRSVVWDFTNEVNAYATPTTVSSATFVVPAGITKASNTNTTYNATAVFTGGTPGRDYVVTCRATFANSDILDKSKVILVREH